MSPFVDLNDLSGATRATWMQYMATIDPQFDGLSTRWPLGLACIALQVLKRTVDSPKYFPKGKWASLQVFEDMIDREINTLSIKRGKKPGF